MYWCVLTLLMCVVMGCMLMCLTCWCWWAVCWCIWRDDVLMCCWFDDFVDWCVVLMVVLMCLSWYVATCWSLFLIVDLMIICRTLWNESYHSWRTGGNWRYSVDLSRVYCSKTYFNVEKVIWWRLRSISFHDCSRYNSPEQKEHTNKQTNNSHLISKHIFCSRVLHKFVEQVLSYVWPGLTELHFSAELNWG